MSIIVGRNDYVHSAEDVVSLESLLRAEEVASILHFSGRNKPWQKTCPQSRTRDMYRRTMRRVERDRLAAEGASGVDSVLLGG
ncbi:hypothetical protein FRP1_29590 (plasmid) [Pseudonocardia sp. EC080625-04]|nr:hypothetical protein FRP1_29590 [Pseudonocardia sp. EC080625-04]ALL85887.1 hypothetical protein AD017_32795 [Pseudonocardia sp. EC080619-01]